MSAIAYLNGEYLPLAQVLISPLDRGFLFADGVYETIPAYNGRLFRLMEHLQRLHNSLAAIRLENNLSVTQWSALLNELVVRNGGSNLVLYLQITRGAAECRDHCFPSETRPTVFAMASPLQPLPEALRRVGISVVTVDDIRWGGCHIKSIALLANVLARQQAIDRKAADALLVRDGRLTEGTASNVFVVCDGILLTPPKDQFILPGITRDLVLELAAANNIVYREQYLPREVLIEADEVWLTSSTKEILPVTSVDGRSIGTGAPGPLWRRMINLYQAYKRKVCQPVMG